MKSLKIVVYGKVQGVWFRARTKEQAEALGVNGYVMNLPDGTVFIRAEGNEPVLEKFVAWVHRGPEQARVDTVEMSEIPPEGFESFEFRHE